MKLPLVFESGSAPAGSGSAQAGGWSVGCYWWCKNGIFILEWKVSKMLWG